MELVIGYSPTKVVAMITIRQLVQVSFLALLSLHLITKVSKTITPIGTYFLGLDAGAVKAVAKRNVSRGPTASSSSARTGAESSNPLAWLHESVQETTSLLYEHSANLSFWLEQPLPKIYVYDTLPHEWSDPTNISDCIHQNFLFDKGTNESWPNCRWYPNRICSDQVAPKSFFETKYVTYRQNYNMDIQYLEWFRNYPLRTQDPQEADLFVIPYPHWSHCLCHKNFKSRSTLCIHELKQIQSSVYKHLEHWNTSDPSSMKRHLWLHGVDWGLLKRDFRDRTYFSLHLGNTPCIRSKLNSPCGHLVVPYLSTDSWYQPQTHGMQGWWENMKDRPYSVGAVIGTPKQLPMRFEFSRTHQTLLGDSVGGKPTQIISLGRGRKPMKSADIAKVYRESILCPVLPGDGPPQKRFFEVMLNGCIPILPLWDSNDRVNGTAFPSLFHEKEASARSTYAYHRYTFYGDDNAGIDYIRDLVVTFNGTCGLECLKGAAEAVLSNSDELARLRGNLRKYTKLFSYGMEGNAYRYSDAFTATLVSMRHYLYSLPK